MVIDAVDVASQALFSSAPVYAERVCAYGSIFERAGVEVSPAAQAAVCIGTFDGVHFGHRDLIEATLADARARGCLAVAVTFDPAPAEVLGFSTPARLLETPDRVRALMARGLDAVVMLHFDAGFSRLSYLTFLDDVLGSLLDPVALHIGNNFKFGAGGAGDIRAIMGWGERAGVTVRPRDLLMREGVIISSTSVRKLLRAGRTMEAAKMLGRAHFVRGSVVHGRGEGTAFGFPTANLRIPSTTCMPQEGVYAALFVVDGWAWPSAVNVGAPPSFASEDDPAFLEANLIGFSGDLYGKDAALIFCDWLRASRVFSSTEELERVVLSNIDWVRTNIGDGGVEVQL